MNSEQAIIKDNVIIDISGLTKTFKDLKAVDDLSFKVKKGELFAFLGVNGAGKSTTINIISGILKKDYGEVNVCGCNIDEGVNSNKIGIVFQNSVLDKKLTVYENLKYRASLYGIFGNTFKERLYEISEILELNEILKRSVEKLSGGQRRRADIARALFHKPELLILDEPTTGLDPKTRIIVWQVIDRLRRENGLTVFLTTHYMEEAAGADYVVILSGGKKVAEGTPHDLKNTYASDFIKIYNYTDEMQNWFASQNMNLKLEKKFLEIEVKNTAEVTELIRKKPELFTDFEVLKGNMDNVFLKVTGKDLTED